MGSHKNGDTPFGSIADEFPELTSRSRIDTACGFVQKDHFGFMEDTDGERQFLFPAQGQRTHEIVLMVAETESL